MEPNTLLIIGLVVWILALVFQVIDFYLELRRFRQKEKYLSHNDDRDGGKDI